MFPKTYFAPTYFTPYYWEPVVVSGGTGGSVAFCVVYCPGAADLEVYS